MSLAAHQVAEKRPPSSSGTCGKFNNVVQAGVHCDDSERVVETPWGHKKLTSPIYADVIGKSKQEDAIRKLLFGWEVEMYLKAANLKRGRRP